MTVLNILATVSRAYVDANTTMVNYSLKGAWSDLGFSSNSSRSGNFMVVTSGADNITTFPSQSAGLTAAFNTYGSAIVTDVNNNFGGGSTFTLGVLVFVDSNVSDYVDSKATYPTTSAQSVSLVGTGNTGTQLSTTRPSKITATASTSATASIAGAATSTITLKKCATNSATEADWTVAGVAETSQSYSLAVALQGVTGAKQQLSTDLPVGWFYKFVSGGSGTHTESIANGEKTIY